ncbi:transposable element Tcb2 transposase [Trichonephila clavipes]|nr:transposable element Tcb2 transposase [Trichonephila clavipes]
MCSRSDESRSRLFNADRRLRIGRQAHETMDHACQVGTVTCHIGSIMSRKGITSIRLWCSVIRMVMEFFSKTTVPLISPDLNPIEALWDVLEQGMKGHHTSPTNLTELWTALANIWQVILVERFQKLVESIPHRVAAVIKARGDPTRY